ncbi:MAG: hypothetical protein H7249_19445 [Chitinophagaceae bacterium]|nr:hypothetical protein [Oligoflexus sp.]
MKSIRKLLVALALGLATLQGACSKDDVKPVANGQQNQYVDELYALVKSVERDLSQGYLLHNATDREKKSFQDVLYEIKVGTMRLKRDPNDAEALTSLYIASQSYNTLSILDIDASQLSALKAKLLETVDAIAHMQGKTLNNLERILFEQLFTYDLAPFTAYNEAGKSGWVKSNHEKISYAYVSSPSANSWLMSPVLDLTKVTNPSFRMSQAVSNRSNPIDSSVFFQVSADYTGGNPNNATWETLHIDRLPDGSGFTVVDTENVSLKRYEGKKIVLAFHYKTGSTSYPIWQINSFDLLGGGTFSTAPLSLVGSAGNEGANAPTVAAGPTNGAIKCSGATAQNAFSFQFGKDFTGNFTAIDPTASITAVVTNYAGVVRFSGYANATTPVKLGTTWLVSKDINLSATKDACLSLSEDIYLGKKATSVDLSNLEVLVSTNYAGDVKTAIWKTVPLKDRKAATGLVNATAFAPKASVVSLKNLVGDGAAKVTVAFKYTVPSLDSDPAWWGVADLTVAATPTAETPVVNSTTPTTPVPVTAVPVDTETGHPFAIGQLIGTTWESTCYRYAATGDYSKKYWEFTAESLTSLVIKYSDTACSTLSRNADGTPNVGTPWVYSGATATALSGNWAVVSANCATGCSSPLQEALRLSGDHLNSASKIKNATPDAYYTADGKFTVYSKVATPTKLSDLAASLGTLPVPAPAEAPTVPVAAVPAP